MEQVITTTKKIEESDDTRPNLRPKVSLISIFDPMKTNTKVKKSKQN